MLVKHEVVMDLHPDQHSENFMYFEAAEPNYPDERTDGYYMTKELWVEFQQPEQITVTVQVGDRINQEAQT